MGAVLPGRPEFATNTKQFLVRNIWHKAAVCASAAGVCSHPWLIALLCSPALHEH